MKSLAVTLAVLVCGLGLGLNIADKDHHAAESNPESKTIYHEIVSKDPVIKAEDFLESLDPPKTFSVKKTIILESKNTITLRGPVTSDSVSAVMKKLLKITEDVSKDVPVYLVLDTPGGSVFDGLNLIDFMEALPHKVHTVTLFAASMGFQIAQNSSKRFIARTGTLMSHRARVGGLSGQVKGELETRYRMIRRTVDYLDVKAAKKMGMSLKDYENLVLNEYWVHGYDAVKDNAADEQVLVRCGTSMKGSVKVIYRTFFGPVVVTFSKCPLIRAPEKVEFEGISQYHRNKVADIFNEIFSNQVGFVEDFISTDEFYKIFP